MSDQNLVPSLSLLDQLKMQHGQFVQQRDLAQNNLNQLIGAIYACEVMIQKHEHEMQKSQEVVNEAKSEEEQKDELTV